jgi:hypothetical protein
MDITRIVLSVCDIFLYCTVAKVGNMVVVFGVAIDRIQTLGCDGGRFSKATAASRTEL